MKIKQEDRESCKKEEKDLINQKLQERWKDDKNEKQNKNKQWLEKEKLR